MNNVPGVEALARMLLRSESVASSFIEGLAVGMGRLLRQQLARELGFDASDSIADEIVSNIEAMSYVIDTFDTTQDLTPQHILDIHLLLAERVRPSIQPGRFRDKQNWIGRNSYNPCGADHVPPPPEYVVALMDDLCAFVNENALPPLVLAAIAHAQFETIHPFIDGNGRTGRALIYLILRRTGTIDSITPPISLALARHSGLYIDGLNSMRVKGPLSAASANQGIQNWLSFFASAVLQSVADANRLRQAVLEIELRWRERVGRLRKGSSADLLLSLLASAPLLSVESAARMIHRSAPAANAAISQLVDANILVQRTVGRRNRMFEAAEIVSLLDALENELLGVMR